MNEIEDVTAIEPVTDETAAEDVTAVGSSTFVGVSRDEPSPLPIIEQEQADTVSIEYATAESDALMLEPDAAPVAFCDVLTPDEQHAVWTFESGKIMRGTNDNDGMFSFIGGNVMTALGGDDMMTSMLGRDTMIGGAGADVFVVWMLEGWSGPVCIRDFEAGDQLISADAVLHADGRNLVTADGLVVVQMQSAEAAALAVTP